MPRKKKFEPFPKGKEKGEWYSEKDQKYHWEGKNKNTGEKKKLSRNNLDELRNAKTQILRFWENNSSTDNMGKTLNDVAQLYFEKLNDEYDGAYRKASTRNNYHAYYRNHVKDALGDILINEITSDDVHQLVRKKYTDEKMSYSSVIMITAVISNIFKVAKSEKIYFGDNPATGAIEEVSRMDKRLRSTVQMEVRSGTKQKTSELDGHAIHKKEDLSIEDTRNFLLYVKDNAPHLFPVLMVLFGTGVRAGELCALQWDSVDLDKAEITIERTLSYLTNYTKEGGCEYVIDTTKTGKTRVVAITPDIVQVLADHKKNTEKTKRVSICDLNNYVFLTKKVKVNNGGKPYTPTNLNQLIRSYVKRYQREVNADFPLFTCHIARHTYITRLYDFGVPVDVAASQVGHTGTTITERVYQHREGSPRVKEALEEYYAKYSILDGKKE